MVQKFTPQRAAPLTPSQRQEQMTREAERRRRERQERENKELPVPEQQIQPQPPQQQQVQQRAPPTTPAPSRLPVPVKTTTAVAASGTPLPNPPNPTPVTAAATTVTKSKPREQRISALTESQIMEKLRSVVTHADPNTSYTKIKKVGQGASGSVYVARYTGTIPLRSKGGANIAGGNKVAIKQMDLANQPRKELIVNEILVMKESQHPNIVNFLDSYLVRGNELWVVMEFMEGGALTDVIDHNNLSEDQISCISLEVRPPHRHRHKPHPTPHFHFWCWVLTEFLDLQGPRTSPRKEHHPPRH
jgi:serine/threonine-protein kinase CLA4